MRAVTPVVVAALMLAVAAAACGGGTSSNAPDGSRSPGETATRTTSRTAVPTETPGPSGTAAAVTPAACPVDEVVCALAVEYEALMIPSGADTLAQRAKRLTVTCPSADASRDDDLVKALDKVCTPAMASESTAVFEFHNGKAPFYFMERDPLARMIEEALTSASGELRLAGVGCGAATKDGPVDCGAHPVAAYASASEGIVVLTFGKTDKGDWAVERLWRPFSLTEITEPGRYGIYTAAEDGTHAVELVPYTPD